MEREKSIVLADLVLGAKPKTPKAKKKEVKTSLREYVGPLKYSTPGARAEYKDRKLGGGAPGNKDFWDRIAKRLETKWAWCGYDTEINNDPEIKKNASIVAVGLGIIKIVLFDEQFENGWGARICRILMANGKVVEWDGKTEATEAEAEKWIVECYLMALSDQLIRLSAQNAKLLGYFD